MLISAIIPTWNRAELLSAALDSLVHQSLAPEQFEVVVIDDGSLDATADVCTRFESQLQLRCLRIGNSGIAAAKNLGIFAAQAPLLFFFDDDDVAEPDLLEQHLAAHSRHPEENVAILGYTTWSPRLRITEVMHYVTDVGQFLFSYGNLRDGQQLDFSYFWGGRSSCKRSLLVQHGIFRQEFRFGSEDIELAYQLSRFGLRVVFHGRAIQYMNRPITYDEFCRRCEKQGRSQYWFSRRHLDPVIANYCEVPGADARWTEGQPQLDIKVERVHALEAALNQTSARPDQERIRRELHSLYGWTFRMFKTKGIVAEGELQHSVH